MPKFFYKDGYDKTQPFFPHQRSLFQPGFYVGENNQGKQLLVNEQQITVEFSPEELAKIAALKAAKEVAK